MISIDASIERLAARLPELSWKLSAIGSTLDPKLLPKGLYRHRFEYTSESCIEEINTDLQAIKQQTNEQATHYIAERVVQKINVLVRICQQHARQKKTERQAPLGVQAISTRQQWLKTMQSEIEALSGQQEALMLAFNDFKLGENTQAMLRVQAELGQAEQRLTQAKETYERSTR